MYQKIAISIPDVKGKITYQTQKNIKYVYFERERNYDADRQFNVPKRSCIGKVVPGDNSKMYPNDNFALFFPDFVLPPVNETVVRSCGLKLGPYILVEWALKRDGIDGIVKDILGSKDGGLLLDLAAYSIVCEDNAAQYYPDYAYNHPLFTEDMHIFSDSTISRFLDSITDEQREEFLNIWNDKRDHRQKIYISYDSTNKNCQAGEVTMVEYGHPKENIGAPIFNIAIAYDRTNRIPLFYEEYLGSIVDVSQLQYMLTKAKAYKYHQVGFILDRGYFCKDNILFMDEAGFDFIIMVKGMKSLLAEAIQEAWGTFEKSRKCYIRDFEVYGTTLNRSLYADDKKKRYIHIYYSNFREAVEQNQLERNLNKMEDTLRQYLNAEKHSWPKKFSDYYQMEFNKEGILIMYRERAEVVEEEMKYCGYFAIATSEKMTAAEALIRYKGRDESEKLFRGDKSYLGSKSMRAHGEEAVSAKLFIEFIALIARNRIHTTLTDAARTMDKRKNFMNVPAALKEMAKIELGRQRDGVYRLDHAVSANQKAILEAFGLTEEDVKRKAVELSKIIADADHKELKTKEIT